MSEHQLHFRRPAAAWTEALPLGNGNLGAMCFGGLRRARLQLNDDTAWSGSPLAAERPPLTDAPTARDALLLARQAVADGHFVEAGEQLRKLQHRHTQSFLPFADLHLEVMHDGETLERQDPDERDSTAPAGDYERTLNLQTATHTASGSIGGLKITHVTWISAPHQVLVHEIHLSEPADVKIQLTSLLRTIEITRALPTHGPNSSLGLLLQMPSDVAPSHDYAAEPIEYSTAEGASLYGALFLSLEHDGSATAAGPGNSDEASGTAHATLRGVRRVRLVAATATTFTGLGQMPAGSAATCMAQAHSLVEQALTLAPDQLRTEHIADHRSLYDRVSLELRSADLPTAHDAEFEGTIQNSRRRSTEERLDAINRGDLAEVAHDPELAALLFHYGRYLLISSSRRGTLPANLQGIWNESLRPPWSSNYTTNINVQMNYWAADTANLPETLEPLFDLIYALERPGTKTAARLYGTPGWVAHHNTDAWAYTEPVGAGTHDPKWAFWPLAGLWLLRHFADHAAFGHQETIMRRAYPLMRSAAEFALAWLQSNPDGTLGTVPSTSPENDFLTPEGRTASVASSSTLDLILIRDHLVMLCSTAGLLGVDDDEIVDAARQALQRLPNIPINPRGVVTEWLTDFEQVDPHHRHLSPLLFVYPGTGPLTLNQETAATRFLDERGDEATGWSLVWKISLRARLRDPHSVDRLLGYVFRDMSTDRGEWIGGLYPNFLAAHPPFQIDGNLGFVAAITECLLQSHRNLIEILPAVPPSFGAGSVRGLVARPGVEVDISWDMDRAEDAQDAPAAARATNVRLRALRPGAIGHHRVRVGGTEHTVFLPAIGKEVHLTFEKSSD